MELLKHFKELAIHPKNAEELEGLILQLAIQGKLTAQWRKDNPDVELASVLLEKINAEKVRLIKEKKIRQERIKKEFAKHETDFNIPDTWTSSNLTQVYYTIGGKQNQVKTNQYLENGKFPIVSQGKSLIEGYSNDNDKLLVLEKPVIVFGDHTREVKFIDFDFVIGADGTKILAPYDGVNSKYLYVFLSSIDLSSRGYARHYSHLKNEAISIPPLEEQKAIVEVVNTLFREVEQLEQLTKTRVQLKTDFVTSALQELTQAVEQDTANQWAFLREHFSAFFTEKTNIKKLRESILQLAVQGKLTHHWRESNPDIEDASVLLERIKAEKAQLAADRKIKKEKLLSTISEEEIPYALPEGWVWCRVGEILNVKSSKRVFKSDYVREGVPFFRSKEIGQLGRGQEVTTELFITRERFEEFKENFGVTKPGDVLIACIGGSIGNTWLVDDREFYYKDGNLVQLDSIPEIESFYLLKYLDSNVFYDSALGRVSGSAYNALTIEKIKKSLFPLPSETEQKAIVEKVNALMALCDTLENEIETRTTNQENWMQSCLREVFEENN